MSYRNNAIEVVGLRKSYGDHEVISGVDLTVGEGSVYALLGPNGAGKTTIVNILATLLTADDGDIRVAGHDVRRAPDRVRASIGVTGQFSAIDERLTGRENLRLMADLAHLERATVAGTVSEMLERFDLVGAADRSAQTYSGGMKRRLDLAMTLIARPRLIFLDEPTTGLDPRSRRELWAIVREQVADGVTVLLTTQYLDEADHLADRIGVLDGGRLVAEGTAAELKRRVPGGQVSVQFTDAATLAAAAASYADATADAEALILQLPNDGTVAGLRRVLDGLDDDGVVGVTVENADLDDVFLALTGHATEAPATEEISA
ncbi:ATP-binding cassette domain-containing protein [Conexibacter stalactiti]|uniref:ATP-binding cassette domain-containing protein n=1 Tax=Conexibacter stalactiti TaxID=1940611 RepID=A0ABU4HQ80_9ACTN|nr:ATP-binding cassette domain-containing protein [Conexibacter stalactiti]MDW5595436.1 ATP-binding cassette domain-containing protein [Conexibacter stalactiti]MEC5036078.1 ATP-binding cassette domain-containing protein [Conexibacter stalactiti]